MSELYIGLISGTSMDGIDAVLVDLTEEKPDCLAARTIPFQAEILEQLARLRSDPDQFPTAATAELDARLGAALAEAAIQIIDLSELPSARIRAIGCHGQTALHHADSAWPHTLQLGDPHRIAAITGLTTVADFRRADLAAGGQGAPLAALLHRELLAIGGQCRVVLNLGGIANLTVLPGDGSVSGFDSGPANCFLDHWYRLNHPEAFDRDGAWAAAGTVDPSWLGHLLTDPYFDRAPPKSTGIEYFSPHWLNSRLPEWANQRPADVQASLVELTAMSVSQAVKRNTPRPPNCLIVCGGGAHNRYLIDRIAAHLDPCPVQSSQAFGLAPDFIEALLFAWLAQQRLHGRRLDATGVTGARHALLYGVVIPGANDPINPNH